MKKGFTLLELLIVVIIIGILASIAIPQYTKTLLKARTAEAMTNLGVLRGAMDRYWYSQISRGEYEDILLRIGQSDEVRESILKLDIDNPNNVGLNNRKWGYGILDWGAAQVEENHPVYVLEAVMLPPDGEINLIDDIADLWIQMDQDGRTSRACELGGDGEFLPGTGGHIPW